MANRESAEVNEAQIAVHWKEEEYYQPPAQFVAQANLTDTNVLERFGVENFPDYYKEYADLLDWYKPWDKTLDSSNPPFWRWFVGGELNASYNCVDRHLAKYQNKTAIHFVPDSENEADPARHLSGTVRAGQRVRRPAAGFLRPKRGDRVTVHLPMAAELAVTMLACARLGVIHSVVFGGFCAQACADRIVDSGSSVLITMDGYWRAGQTPRPQGEGRPCCDLAARGGAAGSRRCSSGSATRASTPQQTAIVDGPRLDRQRRDRRVPRAAGRA